MSKIMKLIGIKSRKASERKVDINTKNKVLNFYAKLLDKEKKLILKENLKDVKFAKNKGIKENLIRRLEIDEIKLKNISNSINKISKLKDPVNVTLKNGVDLMD
jgi:glutamate-5-semialdehyde dehydrogenase